MDWWYPQFNLNWSTQTVLIRKRYKTQLHIFCDSSQQAYGAVAYLTGLSADDGIHIAFLLAKTRVALLKTTTLPRLELLAALLGAKLFQFLNKTLELVNSSEVIYWSDSQIVLSWLSSNKQPQQFVRTRVQKIQEITSSQTWRFLPNVYEPSWLDNPWSKHYYIQR